MDKYVDMKSLRIWLKKMECEFEQNVWKNIRLGNGQKNWEQVNENKECESEEYQKDKIIDGGNWVITFWVGCR